MIVPVALEPPATPFTDHFTDESKFPVPVTTAEHWEFVPVVIEVDEQETVTAVIEGV